jgi:RHS repeat-associated protein
VRQNGADQRYYVYLPDGKLLYSIEADGNKRHFYHFDESGNTAFLTDDGGNVTDAYSMTPYGENLNHTGTSDNPFTFQGQYGVIQEAPGLFYMRSRHYDSATARFLTPDPAVTGDPRGVAPYSYARGNPMVFNDPLGTGWFDWLFGLFSPPETPAVQPDDSSGNPDNSTNPAPDAQNQPPDNSDANPPAPTDGTPTDTSQPTTPDASADPWSATYLPYDPGSFAPTPADGWGQNNGVGDPSSAGDPNDQVFPDGDSLQITKNGMQLISQDGASLTITAWYTTADGGMRLISQDGASFTIPPDVVVPLISQDGASLGSVLSSSIANIVSHDGGSFSPTDISNAIQQIITHDGATLITDNGAAFSPAVVSALMNPGAN